MLTGLLEVAPEEDDDELQAAAVRASSATPAAVSCRRGVRPWMRIVISVSDHTNNKRKEKLHYRYPYWPDRMGHSLAAVAAASASAAADRVRAASSDPTRGCSAKARSASA